MTSSPIMIKLLSGPHSGAEMCLESRFYRVGRSADCDVVIGDRSLPEVAFSLEVSEERVLLECLDPSLTLLCDGEPLDEGCIEVEYYRVYSIGVLHFCFGPSEGQWPNVVAPEGGWGKQTAETRVGVSEPQEAGAPPGEGGSGSAVSQKPALRRTTRVVINFLAVGVVAVWVIMFNSSRLDAGTVERDSVPDLASIVSTEKEFEGLSVVPKVVPEGEPPVWIVSGYVKSESELGVLRQRLNSLNVRYELSLRVMAGIKRSAETLLKQFKLDHFVVAIGDKPGELVISGVQQNIHYWKRMKPLLLSDIPGLLTIDDQVENPESRLGLLKQWIQEEGMGDEVVVNAIDGRLSIRSDIALDRSEGWKRITKKFQDRFGGSIDLAVLSDDRPKINIRAVSLGSVPYMVLTSGRRYIVGSHVKSGYYLVQLNREIVVLKKGEEFIKYRIGAG